MLTSRFESALLNCQRTKALLKVLKTRCSKRVLMKVMHPVASDENVFMKNNINKDNLFNIPFCLG